MHTNEVDSSPGGSPTLPAQRLLRCSVTGLLHLVRDAGGNRGLQGRGSMTGTVGGGGGAGRLQVWAGDKDRYEARIRGWEADGNW